MKCPNCGSAVKIEDKFCSYCGSKNPHFIQEREDMAHFKNEFEKTQKEVVVKAQNKSKYFSSITIICVLILLNLFFFIANNSMWTIESIIDEISISRNAQKYKQQIDKYIEEEDFINLYLYYSNKSLVYHENFNEYRAVFYGNDIYYRIYRDLTDATVLKNGSNETHEIAQNLVENLNHFYSRTVQKEWDDPAQFTPENINTIELIEQEIYALFLYHLDLDKETISPLLETSPLQLATIFEERLSMYEKQA